MTKKLIAHHEVDGQHTVYWWRTKREHRIMYGFDVVKTHNDVHAAECFGYAVRHQIECAGRLDP